MALKSGFYNAFEVNGSYDREYDANVYSDFFSAFLRDGVRRSGLDDFKVSASGMEISVGAGYAIVGGKWIHNEASFPLGSITAPVGDFSRIDGVFLRADSSDPVRDASLILRQGVASSSPVVPSKEETDEAKEILLATILVKAGATSVSVTDTRADKAVCGWITSPVGYDEYFTSLDKNFSDWFDETRDRVASVTLFKKYSWSTTLETDASSINFSIPQYDSTGTDIVEVYVNGLREFEGVHYTRSGSTISFISSATLSGVKEAGAEISVEVYKSIDGTGLGTVSDELTELQNDVAKLSGTSDYDYLCNGIDDNIKLSELAQEWLEGGEDYSSKKIRVFGTFGCSSAFSGSGTSASPYIWLKLGAGSPKNRKLTFDFSNCSQISLPIPNNSENVLLYGFETAVEGINLIATNTTAIINTFSTPTNVTVSAKDSRFWINAKTATFARSGTFERCRISQTCYGGSSYIFNVGNAGLLRVNEGEFYSYGATGNSSAVLYIGSSETSAVAILYGINAPEVVRNGFVQTHAVNILSNSGKCSITDSITPLMITANGQNIRGTLAINKPAMK